MSNPVTIKATGPAGLLSAVPTLLGFQPQRSIVIVLFEGRRTCGVLRLDVTQNADALNSMLGMVAKAAHVTKIVVAIYEHGEHAPDGAMANVAELLRRRAIDMGYEVPDAFVIGDSNWFSTVEPGSPIHPTSDLVLEAAALNIPDDVRSIAPDQGLPPLEHDSRSRLHIRNLMDGMDDYEWTTHFEHAVRFIAAGDSTPLDLARVGRSLNFPALRDLLAPLVILGRTPSNEEEAHLFTGQFAGNVDGKRLTHMLTGLRTIAAAADEGELAANALAMAGWFAWALGRGTWADELLRAAIEEDSDNTLAPLLLTAIMTGMLPEWAYRKQG